MPNCKRSSKRSIRRPARYGDSILSQNQRKGNKNKEKENNQVQKKDVNGSFNGDKRENDADRQEKVSVFMGI